MDDDLFEAVRTTDRRTVLRALREGESIDFESLVTVVANDPDDRTGAAIRLRHAHLPKLEACEVIEWDRDAGTIERGSRFEGVERLLAAFEDDTDDSSQR